MTIEIKEIIDDQQKEYLFNFPNWVSEFPGFWAYFTNVGISHSSALAVVLIFNGKIKTSQRKSKINLTRKSEQNIEMRFSRFADFEYCIRLS